MPAKRNMHVARDAQALAQEVPDGNFIFSAQRRGDEHEQGEVQLRGFHGLITYDQYGDAESLARQGQQSNRKDFQPNPINALLIHSYNGKLTEPGKEKVFLTSLPVDDPLVSYDA